MSYAARPMGDYKTYGYAGDPGWLSSAFKFITKKILPKALQIFGGPVGMVAGTALGVGTAIMSTKPGPPALAPPPGSIGGAVSFPGGTTVSVAGVLPGHAAMGAHAPSGFHLDKATRTRWVRNRRMNVANPRALRKAMRRVQGFEKLAKRTIQFTRRVKIKK
jgi:hypothetical protein